MQVVLEKVGEQNLQIRFRPRLEKLVGRLPRLFWGRRGDSEKPGLSWNRCYQVHCLVILCLYHNLAHIIHNLSRQSARNKRCLNTAPHSHT